MEEFFLRDRLSIFVSGLTIEIHVSMSEMGEIPSGPGRLKIFNILS